MKTFFIAGQQRSGTTLLSVLLDRHPDIYIDSNSIAFRLVSCFGNYKDVLPHNISYSSTEIQSWLIRNDYKGRLAELLDLENYDQFPNAKAAIESGIANRLKENGKTVFGDKAPNMEYFIPPILMLLPEAKFIHIVRDGRAVASSKSKRAHKNIYLSAQEWVDGNIIGLSNQTMIGEERYKIIRYEDLLENSEKILTELCQFLGVPYHPNMLKSSEDENKENSYVKPFLDASKIDNYKDELSPHQINKLEKIQGPLLAKFGYQLNNTSGKNSYRPLSVFQKIKYNQIDNFRQLFIAKRIGMRNRENIEVKIPISTRIKTFIFQLGRDLLPNLIFRRMFRKRWIKSLHIKGKEIK